MTIARLLVRLGAETAEFHQQMQRAARRTEQTGRVFTRIGRSISQAISLPLIAGAFGAFRVLLADSARSFGPLFQVVEALKAELHGLFLAIGKELEPVFRQVIAVIRGGVATLRDWIDAFHRLPAGVRQAIIFTLAFLAALGPTLFVVGKLITAIGALIRIFPLLVSPMGLAVIAVAALGAAALYAATHWEWAALRLALTWTFIKTLFFDGVRGLLLSVDIMTLGLTKIGGATDFLRGKLNVLADQSLAKSAAQILELEAALQKGSSALSETGGIGRNVQQIMQGLNDALRVNQQRMEILGPRYNFAAANAQALEETVNALTAAHVPLNMVLDNQGTTLADLADRLLQTREAADQYARVIATFGPSSAEAAAAFQHWQDLLQRGVGFEVSTRQLEAYRQSILDVSNALRTGVAGAFEALGSRLGQIFSSMSRGFKGFKDVIVGIVGTMLQTIGQALIAFGVAGLAIKNFIKSPAGAIAAGVALMALGSALAASAQGAVSGGAAGLAGGGGASASSSSAPAAEPQGERLLILRLEGGDAVVETLLRDPRNQQALAAVMEELAGDRRVVIETRGGD